MNLDLTAIPDLFGRFHPLLLHFPLGLLLWAGVVEAAELFRRRQIPSNGPASLPFVIPGALLAVFASTSGWMLADPGDPDPVLGWHRWLGVSTTMMALLTMGVGIAVTRGSKVASGAYRVSLFICVPILAAGGHFGGELKWGEGFLEKGFEKVFYATSDSGDGLVEVTASQGDVDSPQEKLGLKLYHEEVRATLDQHCVQCHGPDKVKGKLRLDVAGDLKDLQRDPPVMVPGDPDSSLIVELIMLSDDDEDRMPPPEEPGLSEEEVRGLVEWVRAGAPWPAEGPRGVSGVAGVIGFAGEVGESGAEQQPLPDGHETDEDEDPEDPAALHFKEDVFPLLARTCFECHGPDKQKGGLRLDLKSAVFADREFPTVVSGDPEESELILRVTLGDDDDDRMPPEGERLTEDQIASLSKWIEEGAFWPEAQEVPDQSSSPGVPDTPQARSKTPGQIPEMPKILLENPQVKAEVAQSISALQDLGVRVAPISHNDESHEAVFRLLRRGADDQMVAGLAGLEPVLTRLDLAGTSVTAESIRGLWRFSRLRVLNLSETVIGDDEVATLAGLPELTVLNLFGTKVTDDCLQLLERMPSLRRVYLWRSGVTTAAAQQLASRRPELLVNIGVAKGPQILKATVQVEASGIWPGREEELAVDHGHDGSVTTIWAGPEEARSGWVQLTLDSPHEVVGVVLDEGAFPRIQNFLVEAQVDSNWVEIASGTTIGSKKKILFDPLQAKMIRLKILEAIETPVIAEFDLLVN